MRLFNRNNRQSAPDSPTPSASPAEFARQAEALIPARVCMISGCHSEQTSADVSHVGSVAQLPNPAGRAGGACTSALLEILYANQQNKQLTFQQVLLKLREALAKRGMEQVPQLTSSRSLELSETPFSLVGGNGTCRALLVGINYRGQNGQLSGCHNDVFNIKQYLVQVQGYQEHNILVLVDNGRYHYPTRQAIILALRQLVAQSVAGDSVYVHYSGHGGLLDPQWNAFKTNSKDYDETIYPLDHERSGQIRDFALFNHFVKPMPAGVTVTCVMDCCHSGSVLELPYSFRPTDAGTIRMSRNMSSLTNLAFLYLLFGGFLPPGFDNVAANIEDVTGGNVEDFQGAGMEDAAEDGVNADMVQNTYEGDGGDVADAGTYGDGADGDVADANAYGDAADANAYGDGVDGGDYGNDFGGADGDIARGYDGGFGGDDAGGFGGDGMWDGGGGWDGGDAGMGGWNGADAGDAPDMDCSCIADVLGALLEE